MGLGTFIQFTAGTKAVADDVNHNFDAITTWANHNVTSDNLGTLTNTLQFNVTSNVNPISISNSGNLASLLITQSDNIAIDQAIITIDDSTITQTEATAAEFRIKANPASTIPAIWVTHDLTDTVKLTKNSLNLFGDTTKISADRIRLPIKTTAQRNALVSPEEGSFLYNTDTDQVNLKRSDGWVPVDVPVGCVQLYITTTAPEGWLVCNGTEYLKSAYPKLDAVLSNSGTYPYGQTNGSGGAGTTHFRVPDLRGRVPVGYGTGAGLSSRSLGATGGEENHLLLVSEMPAHRHTWDINYNAGSKPGAQGNGPNLGYDTFTTNTGYTGGNTPHNIMQPFLVMNYIIKY